MHRRLAALLATMAIAILLAAGAASAITYGQPDGDTHPYVGALVVADEEGEFLFCSGNFLGDSQIIASITITGDIPCRSRNDTYRLDTPTAQEFLGEFVELP